MDKTNIDDSYIAMISKEAEKIEEKYSNGQALTNSDIHTLVLKTQYNHINHLDKKLDEVVDTVKNLENSFEITKQELNHRIDLIEKNIDSNTKELNAKIDSNIKELNTKIDSNAKELNAKIDSNIKELKIEIKDTIITQTKWIIGSAGIMIVFLKVIDKFF